jgi:hypothetical protein
MPSPPPIHPAILVLVLAASTPGPKYRTTCVPPFLPSFLLPTFLPSVSGGSSRPCLASVPSPACPNPACVFSRVALAEPKRNEPNRNANPPYAFNLAYHPACPEHRTAKNSSLDARNRLQEEPHANAETRDARSQIKTNERTTPYSAVVPITGLRIPFPSLD